MLVLVEDDVEPGGGVMLGYDIIRMFLALCSLSDGSLCNVTVHY